MRQLCAFGQCLLFSVSLGFSQIRTGTVIYVDISKDEVAFAADSRETSSSGSHVDTKCKILTFGNQFVFSMAGASRGEDWNAQTIARRTWTEESNRESDQRTLVRNVAERWANAMEGVYQKPGVVTDLMRMRKEVFKEAGSDVISNAIFAGSDSAGGVIVYTVNINFDLPLFKLKNEVITRHDGVFRSSGYISAGKGEIIDELTSQKSARAKEYFSTFIPELKRLAPSRVRAEFARRMIELSVQLHPERVQLSLPVDVLVLRRESGSEWIYVKDGCRE